jgi:hypothetical protein
VLANIVTEMLLQLNMRLQVSDESQKISFETGMINVEYSEELLVLKK